MGKLNVEYRNYIESDYEALKTMILSLYTEDPSSQTIRESNIKRTVEEYFLRPDKLTIVMILCEGEIVGYSIIVHFWSNEYGGNILHIDELFIKESYRGKGIGKDFFNHLKALDKDTVALLLEVTPNNTRALKFYQEIGFVKTRNSHYIKTLT
ncbi:MAG TPA: hypothetical protein DCS67_12840 [Clostridiales bacterium UBA8960]|jgi:ribosomal protein S18 acetylase RimI-like enzyme|nr:hypothetical protein [Clostridiales bacterium UBA8960]